ncbi:MAG TPA: type VI secretion system tube protein Hcp [Methylomirabilota bacterium]|nr:type VI secretion system tube protein Hcp [Methylomirabilota bacterium]
MRSTIVLCTVALVSLVLAVACLPAPAAAQIQGFMKIPGLPGESQVIGHENEIELMSYTQSAAAKGCFSAVAVKNLDKASPGLALLAVGKRLVPTVTVTLTRTAGDVPVDVFTALLENVSVVSVELSEFDGGPTPFERVTLQPRRATLSYRQQNPDGSPGAPVIAVVNC